MRFRRTLLHAAGVFVVLVVAVLVVLAAGASAGRRAVSGSPSVLTFTDPAGDASGAPDITNVAIEGDAGTGFMTVSVTAPGHKAPIPDGRTRYIGVYLDTDRNPLTGDGGSEYQLVYADDPADPTHWWNMARWDGTAWQSLTYARTMGFNRDGDVLTWSLSTAELGGATSFAVIVEASMWDADGNRIAGAQDDSPDAGAWVYDISGPARTMTKFVQPVIGTPTTVPAQVRAGKRVTVSFAVTGGEGDDTKPLTMGSMICDPSVAAKVIPHAESFSNGVARLSFVVPKTAKGKLLKVRVTIRAASYQGGNGTMIDVATGYTSLMATMYSGQSATRVVAFPVR